MLFHVSCLSYSKNRSRNWKTCDKVRIDTVPQLRSILEDHARYHKGPSPTFLCSRISFTLSSIVSWNPHSLKCLQLAPLFFSRISRNIGILLLLNLNWILSSFTFDMIIRHPLARTWISPLVSSGALLSCLLLAFFWHTYPLVWFGPSTMNAVIQKGLHRTINLCDLCIGLYVHFIGFLERSITPRKVRKWCWADDLEVKSTGYESMRTKI